MAKPGRNGKIFQAPRALFGWLRRMSSVMVLSTDELPAYRWIGRKFRAHLRVNHSAGEDVGTDPNVAAQAHSNTAENWHWISIKHFDWSCTETAFRRNHRNHDARLSPLFGGNVGRVACKVLSA